MKVHICPIVMYGSSTCLAPKIINVIKFATKIQNNIFDTGLKVNPRKLERSKAGKVKSTNRAANINMTPNNLFGIERNIA